MKLNLRKELQAVGSEMAPDQFQELVHAELVSHYPGWTDEELLCRPDEAKRFCNLVRVHCQAPVCDYVICRTLTNRRKRACAA